MTKALKDSLRGWPATWLGVGTVALLVSTRDWFGFGAIIDNSLLICAAVWFRAWIGALFIVFSLRLVRECRRELALREGRGQNGIESAILIDQIADAKERVVRIAIFSLTAFASAPFVLRAGVTYRGPQVFSSLMMLALLLVDVGGVIRKTRTQSKLLRTARNYRLKTQAEGGPPPAIHLGGD